MGGRGIGGVGGLGCCLPFIIVVWTSKFVQCIFTKCSNTSDRNRILFIFLLHFTSSLLSVSLSTLLSLCYLGLLEAVLHEELCEGVVEVAPVVPYPMVLVRVGLLPEQDILLLQSSG